jgi:ankyrin repeat protein
MERWCICCSMPGANPNAKTLHGTTALIAAAMEGDGAAAGSLLKTGADPALEDE